MDQHTLRMAREAYARTQSATTPDEMIAAWIAASNQLGMLLHAIEMEERVRSAQNAVKP